MDIPSYFSYGFGDLYPNFLCIEQPGWKDKFIPPWYPDPQDDTMFPVTPSSDVDLFNLLPYRDLLLLAAVSC